MFQRSGGVEGSCYESRMISVVIPTLNDERELVSTLAPLVTAAADGMVRDVVVADGGSTDGTRDVADIAGCNFLSEVPERGARLAAGARLAKGPWLLFMAPGTVLEAGWHHEARTIIETLERQGQSRQRALVFRYALDDIDLRARLRERLVSLHRFITGIPRFEQCVLIHQAHYEKLGGFRALPSLEVEDFARRLGRSRTVTLRSRAFAPLSVAPRTARDAVRFGLLALRVPPSLLARF
jgi:hypothetical protein